ncbi:MAG: peptidylprolyl isomerase, partial [Pirellulales bacterium]|nr:peptidylprolyl isomerase [Pirellulales bacterium]
MADSVSHLSAVGKARWRRAGKLVLLSAAVLSICVAIRLMWQTGTAQAEGPAAPAASGQPAARVASRTAELPHLPGAGREKLQIVAVINQEPVSRDELGKQCLWRYGKDVLESMVNRRIIEAECRRQQITITQKDVDAEIDRMAQRFGFSTPQWLKMLEEERHIKPTQYAKDIIWPTLALQHIASSKLTVTQQDLQEAWETQYGETIQARLISCSDRRKADKVRELAMQKPDDFGNLAKQYSEDRGSASIKGLIQPIRKHLGDKELERVAFSLQEGQISEVIQVQNQFVILKCEGRYPPRDVKMEQVQQLLTEAIRDKKLRDAADELLHALQAKSVVDVVYSDPQKRAASPGIAAKVDQTTITVGQLTDECIERYGEDVLDAHINRRLVEQACRGKKIQVTPAEIDAEVRDAAVALGKADINTGEADLPAFYQYLASEGLSKELYVYDVIWPTLALRKMVAPQVEVSETDIERGFEANYGPRVRCRAIVMNNLRRAQEVWEMASDNPTVEYFSSLAEQYSIEPTSRSLRGEIPPIQKWCGEPVLQQEAFSLKPGEMSSVIQVGDNFVMLWCEGYTDGMKISVEEVHDEIYADVHQKKLKVLMSKQFDQIREGAQIDNYLAGTTQAPERGRPNVSLDPSVEPTAAAAPRAGSPAGAATGPATKGRPAPATAR